VRVTASADFDRLEEVLVVRTPPPDAQVEEGAK
jgi:hypothetical protein